MAGRASIVGAAATHVGNVREHNEDAHFFDADAGVFLVCDGMGGHAAGEVASALAVRTIRSEWANADTQKLADAWLACGTPDAKRQLLGVIRAGVLAAHAMILSEAASDDAKTGMGTTLVGAMVVGNELVFAHAGDSRAYLVRDAIAMQLTEDHTLLARLLAAGIEVDVSGEGSRFRSMLTNALGIGEECKVSTFVVPLADGDRFLFCSDGITEYVKEAEIGDVLSKQPSPARAAQKLIDLALERGGGDNATTIVVRVLEAGEAPQPADQISRDNVAIAACPLWGTRVNPQQRLRALRIAITRDYAAGERLPAHTLGDRVAWLLVEGELVQEGVPIQPGALVYPESLIRDSQAPDRDGLAVAAKDVRALALRADDFRELCDEDSELGEALLEALAALVANRPARGPRPDRLEPELEAETTEIAEPPLPVTTVTTASSNRIASELDARFDAMWETPSATPAVKPPPSTERIPLTLKPRAVPETPRARVATAGAIAIPPPPRNMIPGSPAPRRADTAPGRAYVRPPSEPDIETVVEIEAEDPPDDAAEVGGHELIEICVETDQARVTETVLDTTMQTVVVTRTEPVSSRQPTVVVADDEPTTVRKPIPQSAAQPATRKRGWDE